MSLTRDLIKSQVIQPALLSVADFSGNIEDFNFTSFQPTHQSVFLNKIKSTLNGIPVTDGGTPYPQYMYDIILNPSIFSGWSTVKDCIDYTTNNYSTGPR